MRLTLSILAAVFSGWLIGCSSLMLKPADFSWPVESVLKADSNGMIQENRYQLSFSVRPLLFEETGDSANASEVTIRMIRDHMGYYFIAAPKFKNVYVFATAEGGLKLEKKIMISAGGMNAPAFNSRAPYIQLLNENDKPRLLSKDGIHVGTQR